MPPIGRMRVACGRMLRIDFNTAGVSSAAGKSLSASAPFASAANASVGVATPGKHARPACFAARTTSGSPCGMTIIRPPTFTTSATWAGAVTVPAPIRTSSSYFAFSRSMLSSGRGELSGTSRIANPASTRDSETAMTSSGVTPRRMAMSGRRSRKGWIMAAGPPRDEGPGCAARMETVCVSMRVTVVRCRLPVRATGRSGDRRNGVRRAILAGQHLVRPRRIGTGEALVLGVDDEWNAQRERRLLEIDVVVAQVLDHAAVRLAQQLVGLDLVLELRAARRLADLVRDVAQVAERARDVAFLDRAVLILRLPAADHVDEVLHVAVLALELLHDLARLVIRGGVEVLGRDEASALAVDHVADVDAAVLVHAAAAATLIRRRITGLRDSDACLLRQPAYLEQQRRRGVVVDDDLRVRRVAVVDVSETAADAQRVARQARFAQEPARNVHLMDALVADVAVAVEVDPVPVVVDRTPTRIVPLRRHERRRPAPLVVVHRRGDRLWAVRLADAVAALVAEATGHGDLAEVPRLDPLHRLAQPLARADLRARLDDLVVLLGGVHELAPLPHVVRDRLLDVHVLAVLDCPDRAERVPVVRRRDGDRVDFAARQQLANVGVGLDVRAELRARLRLVEHRRVGIADRNDAHALDLGEAREVVHASAVQADHGDADVVVGAEHIGPGAGGEDGAGSSQRRCLQERAA